MWTALPNGSLVLAALAAAALLVAAPAPARAGATLYVSKLGSGEGGRSWADAFTTMGGLHGGPWSTRLSCTAGWYRCL
ncbi:MAG: hypothetical protein NT029_06830 [Armatimonadetes bacterium]|nr:hypothetical protein [Armatimonadota bacterium]